MREFVLKVRGEDKSQELQYHCAFGNQAFRILQSHSSRYARCKKTAFGAASDIQCFPRRRLSEKSKKLGKAF